MSRLTLWRYVLREMAVPFLLFLGTLTFLLFMNKFMDITETVVGGEMDLFVVLRLFILLLPSLLIIVLPMSLLVGTLIAFTRLSFDSEVTAFYASGLSLYRLATPPILLGLGISIVMIPFYEKTVVGATDGFMELSRQIIRDRIMAGIRGGVVHTPDESTVIYAQSLDRESGHMHRVSLKAKISNREVLILAERGKVSIDTLGSSAVFDLVKGEIHPFDLGEGADSNFRIGFREYREVLPLKMKKSVPKGEWVLRSTGRSRLREIMRADAEETVWSLVGITATSERLRRDTLHFQRLAGVEYHRRLAIPFASLTFVLLGVPFGLVARRGGRAFGFFLCVLICLLYYGIATLSAAVGANGRMPVFLAAWLPNMVTAAIGGVALARAAGRSRS